MRTARAYRNTKAYDMLQSANKQTPLGIFAFWDKPIPYPPVRWEKWGVQFKLALIAKKEYHSWYFSRTETSDGGSSFQSPSVRSQLLVLLAQSEIGRNARNAQEKMNRQNKCQRLNEMGIMSGDKPWPHAEKRTISLLYLSTGVEGRRILSRKSPHIMIDTLSTEEVWKIVEAAFIRPGIYPSIVIFSWTRNNFEEKLSNISKVSAKK